MTHPLLYGVMGPRRRLTMKDWPGPAVTRPRTDAASSAPAAEEAFNEFYEDARQRLTRALAGTIGPQDALDATQTALTWAWEHWDELVRMENPHGYLYRVAISARSRRKIGHLPAPAHVGVPEVEPALIRGLRRLSVRQRQAVWLCVACDWTHAEAAQALGISTSAVSSHVARALASLRRAIGATETQTTNERRAHERHAHLPDS